MNILCIPTTYGFSKPISGGQNRFSNLVRELKNRDNQIILLESDLMVDERDELIANIYVYDDYKFQNKVLTIFRDINIYYIAQLYNIIKNEKVDLIQITHPSGIFISKIILFLTKKKVPIVYDAQNVEANFIIETYLLSKEHSRFEYVLVKKYTEYLEKYISKYFVNHITSVSNVDVLTFIGNYKINSNKISCIPSGCYIKKIPETSSKRNIKEKLGIDEQKIIVFFHGLFSHPPNRDAFETIKNYIAPRFEQLDENVLFLVGGSGFPVFDYSNIKSIGFIDELYDTISVCDIAIAPLSKGAGTKLKIFDYMSMGIPIVTTKKGAEGIKITDREHAIIVESIDDEFINSIKYLVDNEFERKRIGLNARRLAEIEYDWEKIGENLNNLYMSIIMEKQLE